MRKTYHLCWSGGNELLFRTKEDYVHCIVCLSLAAYKTDTTILAYCLMSNHVHLCIRTSDVKSFITNFRYPYSCYFNSKNERRGRLGERDFFVSEIKGHHHILAVIAYILRNPLHHGVCATPFEYAYSSIRAAFQTELGYKDYVDRIELKARYYRMPDRNHLASGILMNNDGLILPECIVDVAELEHLFTTARTYLYYMNRISGEEWEKEQLKDVGSTAAIRIHDIENGVKCDSIIRLLGNESGRRRQHTMSDIEICTMIDSFIVEKLGAKSIYTISDDIRQNIAQHLRTRYRLSPDQIIRCLTINRQKNPLL